MSITGAYYQTRHKILNWILDKEKEVQKTWSGESLGFRLLFSLTTTKYVKMYKE